MHTKTPAPEVHVKFDYKSRIFIMIFSSRRNFKGIFGIQQIGGDKSEYI